MSGPHATISAWTRDEHEGHYTAELHDWKLAVRWTPNSIAKDGSPKRGAFDWVAERSGIQRHSEHHFEELELAMAEAEHFAAADAKHRAAKLSQPDTDSETHS